MASKQSQYRILFSSSYSPLTISLSSSTRNDLLLPILEPAYVVRQIISSLRRNVRVLCLPWIVNFLSLTKAFPVPGQLFLTDGLGVGETMDAFKGRQETK
jgi:hypothetical protein